MKTTIVCGMLGSGKTSFIKNVLKNSREKAVVLVNDFGTADIDGEIFSADGIEMIELPSGCVCCTLKFDMMTSLKKIVGTLKPDHLYIEPSGVASPSAVIESLDCLDIRPYTVIGILDATEFLEIYGSDMYGAFFLDQVANSDIMLVNKSDLAGTETAAKTARVLEGLNPRAVIYTTVNAVITEQLPEPAGLVQKKISGAGHRLNFETLALKVAGQVDLDAVQSLFLSMAEGKYGAVVRAKALVQTGGGPYRLDFASGRFAAVPFEQEVAESRIVIIGTNLNRELINGMKLDAA